MTNNLAPVCPVSRDQPVADQPPALQSVYRATDLPSLIQAINAIGRNLRQMVGPGLPANNLRPAVIPQVQNRNLTVQSYYYERGRVTNDGFIYNYDSGKFDKTQRVEVERIYQISFSPSGSSVNPGMDWKWQEQPYNDGALQ